MCRPGGREVITLPFPPSANRYWRTIARHGKVRTYVSNEARAYKESAWYAATAQRMRQFAGPVSVTALFFFPSKRGDLDNRIKVLLDALQGSGYKDDKQVHHLEVTRRIDKTNPRVEVLIVGYEG